jgi:hypothetical protein
MEVSYWKRSIGILIEVFLTDDEVWDLSVTGMNLRFC